MSVIAATSQHIYNYMCDCTILSSSIGPPLELTSCPGAEAEYLPDFPGTGSRRLEPNQIMLAQLDIFTGISSTAGDPAWEYPLLLREGVPL